MACVTYDIICPIGAVGGECTFTINCCDGTKTSVTIPEEDTQQVCLEVPANIVVTSISGSYTVHQALLVQLTVVMLTLLLYLHLLPLQYLHLGLAQFQLHPLL